MKRILLLSCLIWLAANLLFWVILSSYGGYNAAISSGVIVATGLLLLLTDTVRLKDAYKVSLMLVFAACGLLEYILALVAPNRLTDNWWLIGVIALLSFEVILLIVTNTVSNKIK